MAYGNRSADLDPPFRPLSSEYTALLPWGARAPALHLASSRPGDWVMLDASDCEGLFSANWTVEPPAGKQLWRQEYLLEGQQRLQQRCRLQVLVLTSQLGEDSGSGGVTADTPGAVPAPSARNTSSGGSSPASSCITTSSAGRGCPQQYLRLYAQYAVRLVPLSSPERLALGAISFSNATTVFLACGVPQLLQHLFQLPAPPLAPANASSNSSSGGNLSSLNASTQGAANASVADDGLQGLGDSALALLLSRPQPMHISTITGGAPQEELAGADTELPPPALCELQPLQPQLQHAPYQLRDPASRRLVVWASWTRPVCSPDQYVLVPLEAVADGMALQWELAQPGTGEGEGVDVSMSSMLMLLPPGNASTAAAAGGDELAAAAGLPPALAPRFELGSGAEAAMALPEVAAMAAADSPLANLSGLVAQMPIITRADAGHSSSTYTVVLFTNASAAGELAATHVPASSPARLAPPGGPDEDAQLRAQLFGSQPPAWAPVPAAAANCSICPAGMYSTRAGAGECQVCPPGKFAAAPLSSGCAACPRGTFSTRWGSDACRVCLPGTFAVGEASLYCDLCPQGLTTRGEGASACEVRCAFGLWCERAVWACALHGGWAGQRFSVQCTALNPTINNAAMPSPPPRPRRSTLARRRRLRPAVAASCCHLPWCWTARASRQSAAKPQASMAAVKASWRCWWRVTLQLPCRCR